MYIYRGDTLVQFSNTSFLGRIGSNLTQYLTGTDLNVGKPTGKQKLLAAYKSLNLY